MIQIIQAANLTLRDLKTKYSLQQISDNKFFREWVDNLPELTDLEKQLLDRVKVNYLHLVERPMLENTIKMVVVSPLLDLAGFYQAPFDIDSEREASMPISAEDEGIIFKGKIDVLVLHGQLWVVVVESKRAKFSLEPGIPQALAYMVDNPNPAQPAFGMVTNGSNFRFIKLTKQGIPQYALSYEFTINRGDDFYNVLRVLKHFGQLITIN